MHSISSPTVHTVSKTSARKRALLRPVTCPVCFEQLSPPVPHSCGALRLADGSLVDQSILEDLSAISEYLSTGGVLPSVEQYFGYEEVG